MKNNKDSLLLLSELLRDRELNPSLKYFVDFQEESERFIKTIADKTEYPNKYLLQTTFDSIAQQIKLFVMFPQIVGSHITCYIGLSSIQRKRIFGNKNLTQLNESVPIIYSGNSKLCNFGLFNHLGEKIDTDNISNSFQQLKEHLNPEDVLLAIAIKSNKLSSNEILVDIPRNTKDMPFVKSFLSIANRIVVHKRFPIVDESLRYLEYIDSFATVNILPLPGADNFHYSLQFKNDEPKTNIDPKAQFVFDLSIKTTIQKIILWLQNEQGKYSEQIKLINSDLVQNSNDNKFSSLVKNIRTQAKNTVQQLETSIKIVTKAKSQLLSQVNIIYSILEHIYNQNHHISIDNSVLCWNNWSYAEEYFLSLVHTSSLKEANALSDRLKMAKYPYTDILNAYLKQFNNNMNDITIDSKIFFKENKKFLHRSAIHFSNYDEKNITHIAEHHAKKIICSTGKEFYFLWLATNKESFLRKALQKGYAPAGRKLYELALMKKEKEKQKSLKFLARNLVAEANFELSKKNKSFYAQLNLRIAAALKYTPALLKLAENRDNVQLSLMLYRYLAENNLLDSRSYYLYGYRLYQNKYFIEAFDILQKSSETRALSLLARMYQYGNGIPRDLKKAKTLYEELLLKNSDPKAEVQLKKINDEIKRQTRTTKSFNYTKQTRTTSSYSSSSSWCFLTTATCDVMGYKDDCDVLNTFRNYRDKVLIYEKDGKELIEEYYRIAPMIVDSINRSSNAIKTYTFMWEKYINPCYNYSDYNGLCGIS